MLAKMNLVTAFPAVQYFRPIKSVQMTRLEHPEMYKMCCLPWQHNDGGRHVL